VTAVPTGLLLASTNRHKAREIRALLAPLGFTVESPERLDPVEETGVTFRENALLKARAAAALHGREALAEDSGLVVPALGGEPGVRSARYAGEGATDDENNALLVARLQAKGLLDPPARFVCHAVVCAPDGSIRAEGSGEVEGVLRWPPRGTRGFGYDPLFHHPPSGCRLSELEPERKNEVSHRGRALRALAAVLRGGAARHH
jgi:XTP/dITP diphosphohydrolase